MKVFNIMAACSNDLSRYILPQLMSIQENLSHANINFFLFHSRINKVNLLQIKRFVEERCPNIRLHEIRIEDIEPYAYIEKNASQSKGNYEAYFMIRLQDHLPKTVDRVLYIDAGDVIVEGDIAPYYEEDFEDNSLMVTGMNYHFNELIGKKVPYGREERITVVDQRISVFNTGAFMINVDKFREKGYTYEGYMTLARHLKNHPGIVTEAYDSVKGFLSVAFLGETKFYGYHPEFDPKWTPYNFSTSFFAKYPHCALEYDPFIYHFDVPAKPWLLRLSKARIKCVMATVSLVEERLNEKYEQSFIHHLTESHLTLCERWWHYAKKTPIYHEVVREARGSTNFFINQYLKITSDVESYSYLENQVESA